MAAEPEGTQPLPGKSLADQSYAPALEFSIHILVGCVIFFVLLGAAWLLHRATEWVRHDGELLFLGLKTVEVALFCADVTLFLLFIAKTTWIAARKLLRNWNDE